MKRRRRGSPPSDRRVSFIAAEAEIRKLLPHHADPLVTVLADIEAAMQQSADPLLTPTIREHCYAALRVIDDIKKRHGKGNLSESATDCLNEIRTDVKRALARLDVASGGLKLLDHYSEFRRRLHTCENCGWTGSGAMMTSGKSTGLGIDKHCPKCGKFYVFAKFSVLVEKGTPDDWPPVSE